ncbi:hypothetical protein [Arthrobacter dokdonensis]|uniref:hypothetical protein n=1 Tax=Arthrobacter dokdonellae TaxID=2211210 RepID=UPI001013C3EC|nr:hypothetical protein [Arthrobacter dokdonellae]
MESSERAMPAKPKKRSWWISTHHVVHCYPNSAADCIVSSLWETSAGVAESFHDAELVRATSEINTILAKAGAAREEGRNLSFVVVANRPFLVWTTPSAEGPDEPGALGPNDDLDTIKKALGLKMEKPVKPHKRSWVLGPVTHKIYCFASPAGDCLVHGLWETADDAVASFHDAGLARATREINAVLSGVNDKKDRSRNLSFIVVEGSPFLVWTEPGAVGPDDDAETVAGALGLKS